MDKIVDLYNQDPSNKELEIRIKNVDRNLFSRILDLIINQKFGKSATKVTSSLDVVTVIDNIVYKRKTITFAGNTKTIEHVEKKILQYVFIQGTKVNLSVEKPIAQFSSDNATFARLKLRLTFLVENLSDWHFDLTIVRQIKIEDLSHVSSIKNQFFVLPNENFSNLPCDLATHYEVELEYAQKEVDAETITSAIRQFWEVVDPAIIKKREQQHAIYDVAKHIVEKKLLPWFKSKHNLKQLGNSPISIDKNIYFHDIVPAIDNYYLTDKADGERCIILLQKDNSFAVTSTTVYRLDLKVDKIVILDAEKVGNDYYTFDVMYYGESLVKKHFEERLALLPDATRHLGKLGNTKTFIHLSKENYKAEIKNFYDDEHRVYPIDGLLFTPAKNKISYVSNYASMKVYKWKPVDKLTIDFMLVCAPKSLIGIEPYAKLPGHQLYFLFCGIRPDLFQKLKLEYIPEQKNMVGHLYAENYFPIPFTPSSNPYAYLYQHPKEDDTLSYHIGEFIWRNEAWHLIKLRPDKDVDIELKNNFGNDFKTADLTWQNYQNPLTLENLISDPSGYFAQQKSDFYQAAIGFNSFVKSLLINNFIDSDFVIDLAAGQGQDLFRLANVGVKTALFIDQDTNAIEELNKRKYSIETPMKVLTLIANLTESFDHLVTRIRKSFHVKKANGIMMNFAIHYFAKDLKSLQNIVLLIDSLLDKGGRVIITCFDGHKIQSKLVNYDFGNSWDIYENNVLKYSIKRLFKSDEYSKFGQKIAVKLPFSGAEYYEEYLVDIDELISLFEKKKYEVEINRSFDEYLPKFEQANKKTYASLTAQDKEYVGYYVAITLWKP